MIDSINFQLNQSIPIIELNEFITLYLYSILNGDFSKTFAYRNGYYYYVKLKYDSNKLKSRYYYSIKSFIFHKLFKIECDTQKEFRYVSFY